MLKSVWRREEASGGVWEVSGSRKRPEAAVKYPTVLKHPDAIVKHPEAAVQHPVVLKRLNATRKRLLGKGFQ